MTSSQCNEMETGEGVATEDLYSRTRTILASYQDYGCETDCMADVKATRASYSIDRDEDYILSIAEDTSLVTRGQLTVPSGSLVSSSDKSTMHIYQFADSSGRQVENKIQFTRVDDHGSHKTYAQTVLSPAFKCTVAEDVTDPFELSWIYTATINPFPIKGDEGWMSGYDYNDVCFARVEEHVSQLSDGRWFEYFTWKCLVMDEDRLAFPVRSTDSTDPEGVVSGTVTTCNSTGGAIYAFIHAPLDLGTDDSFFWTWLQDHASEVMLIIIGTLFFLFAIVYACFRLARYRKKYHKERAECEKLVERVDEMAQFGGKAGRKDLEVVLVANPMVLQMKEAEDITQEELERRQKEIIAREKRSNEMQLKIELLQDKRNAYQRELDQLRTQLQQATSDEKKAKAVAPVVQQNVSYGFDEDDDDIEVHDIGFGGGGFGDSDSD